MNELHKISLGVDLAHGHCMFDELPIPSDLRGVVRKWQRLAWFTEEGFPTVFVHNIGVKPGDPSTDVLFAFTFFCFHTRLRSQLRKAGLLEEVPACGSSILPVIPCTQSTEIGVPPFMDDLFIPLSDVDPSVLIDNVIQAARNLDMVAKEFGFTMQYGPG